MQRNRRSRKSSLPSAKASRLQYEVQRATPIYPELDPQETFQKSVAAERRPSHKLLRAAAKIVPVRRCIDRIADGVSSMPFSVIPPAKFKDIPEAQEYIDSIDLALSRPNRDRYNNTYRKIVYSIIEEMLVLGFAAIERQPGNDIQSFWWWVCDGARIKENSDWSPDDPSSPCYLMNDPNNNKEIPFPVSDMFIIQKRTSAFEVIPPSPTEVALPYVAAWIALQEFQQRTTGKASSEYLLDLGDVTQDELEAFREYWRNRVSGSGETPIGAGKGQMNVMKLGAPNDSGLYLQYNEHLLKAIALAFNLTPRDMAITEHDNRATSGAAADAAYQEAILPYSICLVEHINLELINFFQQGYRVEFTDTEPRTEQQEGQIAQQLYKAGIITLNEARLRTKHKPVGPEGDVFADGKNADGSQPEEEENSMQNLFDFSF